MRSLLSIVGLALVAVSVAPISVLGSISYNADLDALLSMDSVESAAGHCHGCSNIWKLHCGSWACIELNDDSQDSVLSADMQQQKSEHCSEFSHRHGYESWACSNHEETEEEEEKPIRKRSNPEKKLKKLEKRLEKLLAKIQKLAAGEY